LLAFGSGILIPTLPLFAGSFDLSFSMISLVIAGSSIGTVIGDVPAGMLLERINRRTGMIAGVAIILVSLLGVAMASTGVELIFYRIISGFGMALWNISRHTYITDVIANATRGRALAIFGGINRVGTFASPAIGGILGAAFGLRLPMFFSAAMAGMVLLLAILYIRDDKPPLNHTSDQGAWPRIHQMFLTHWRVLYTAGSAQIFAQMIRQGRRLLIPLYGASVVGLNVEDIGYIVTISAAVDMMLFPLAGHIMDKYGRKYVSVPSFVLMGIGMALIPLSSTFLGLMMATVVIGLGNGLGSGCMMTLGADLAPAASTGQFLGIWRFIGDMGGVGGPLAVGNFADLFGLDTAAYSLAGVGLLASLTLLFLVPETLRKKDQAQPLAR
jgi:MFS family permease